MDKWFRNEEDRLRKYTQKRLKRNSWNGFFRKLSVTNWIILFNCIVFFFLFFAIQIFGIDKIVSLVALQANSFFSGKYWTVLTSMFVHIEVWHLFANMLSLFFIGNFVERIIGRKRFFILYIVSGIFAGLFFVFLSYIFGSSCIFNFGSGCIGEKLFFKPNIPAVGASGAIFSLLGVLAVLTPYTKVYLIMGPIVAIILQAVFHSVYPASSFNSLIELIVFIYTMIAIFSIFSLNPRFVRISLPLKTPFYLLPVIAIVPLILIGLFVDLPFGNTAHFGGLVAGLFYGAYLSNKYRNKTAMIRRYFVN